jgi:hypothetical protein
MRGFPVCVLVRSAEPCDTQRSRITKRAADISESGPIRDRGLERVDDPTRIVAQEKPGQLGVLQPRASVTTDCEKSWQFCGGPLAKRHEVYRLAPLCRLISTSRGHHLADDKGHQVGGVLPADEVEALEGFVYEVERVSDICKKRGRSR